ncbi:MAG: hypothetical protein GX036_02880 [Firmicutes bacterium]|nr:hypothetical protein [Bacillota bacterium]
MLVELDFDYRITNSTGTWYVTLEFFLTKEKPTIGDKKDEEVRKAVTDEVMIFFDWYDSLHSPQVSGAIADGSYTYDLFREEKWPDWFYFDFRIGKKGKIPEKIDLSLFLDYIKDARGEISDLWLGAVEFGIMYSDRTAGRALVKKFDLVINGDRVSSGRQ